jgi:geranylgeranyl diphosphate synthase type I
MTTEKKLVLQVKALLWERGQKGLEMARQIMLQENIPYEPLQVAVRYFMSSWEDVLHPALLSLACEAVGGNPEATTQVGAALVLLSGGADLHDDIIDQSIVKDSKPTVFGKFGKDLTILAGDALLFKGLYELHEACEALSKNQKQSILELTKQAFFGISSAEAKETSLRRKTDSAEEYFEMVKMKAAVGEAITKIGAIIGGGTTEEIEILGHYGKTIGILYTLRDEFVDIFELDELKNRVEKECLPLPILVTLQEAKKKDKIIKLLKREIKEKQVEQIVNLVIGSEETLRLKKKMQDLINDEIQRICFLKNCVNMLRLFLESTIEDLT